MLLYPFSRHKSRGMRADQNAGKDEPDDRAQPDALEEGNADERRCEDYQKREENRVDIHVRTSL